MKTKVSIPYETNAERRTVEGWCCKTCGRFYGDDSGSERVAKYCCATDRPCERCETGRANKCYTLCDGCRSLASIERFEKLESKPYDGTAVVEWDGDRYFFDSDDLVDWIADQEISAEDVRLVFAECTPPRWGHTVSELLGDDLYEGADWDTREIDDQIAAWVEKNAPNVYWPTSVAVSQASIAALMEGGA